MAFPTTSILDNFNRSNESGIGAGAGTWTSPVFSGDGDIALTSNQIVFVGWDSAYYDAAQYGPDSEVYATVTATSATGTEIVCRHNPSGVGGGVYNYMLHTSRTVMEFYWTHNGTQTQLGASVSVTIADGDSIGLEAVGSTLTAYHKPAAGSWTSKGTRTDSSITAAGYVGIAGNGSNVDNFGGGTISGGGTLQALQAAPAGSATVTPVLTVQKNLAATIAGTSTVAAVLTDIKNLATSIAGSSSVTADLTTATTQLLQAAIAGSAGVTAALTVTKNLAATIAGSSDVAAVLTATKSLVASIPGSSAVSAVLTDTKLLAASIAGSSDVVANLSAGATTVARRAREWFFGLLR